MREKILCLENNKEKTRKKITQPIRAIAAVLVKAKTGKVPYETFYQETTEEFKKRKNRWLFEEQNKEKTRAYLGKQYDFMGNLVRVYLESDDEYKQRKKIEKLDEKLEEFDKTGDFSLLPKKYQNFFDKVRNKEWDVVHWGGSEVRFQSNASGLEVLFEIMTRIDEVEENIIIDLDLSTLFEIDGEEVEILDLFDAPKQDVIDSISEAYKELIQILSSRKFDDITFQWAAEYYSIKELTKITPIAKKFNRWLK